MYLYSIIVCINGIRKSDEVWGENGRDALESAEIKYPYAEYIEM